MHTTAQVKGDRGFLVQGSCVDAAFFFKSLFSSRAFAQVRLDAGGGEEGVRGVHSSAARLVCTHEGVRGRLVVPRAALIVGGL